MTRLQTSFVRTRRRALALVLALHAVALAVGALTHHGHPRAHASDIEAHSVQTATHG